MPVFKDIFTSIKPILYTAAQVNKAEHPDTANGIQLYQADMSTSPPTTSDIKIPWSWDDYFTHLSYFGLKHTDAYLQIYPQNSAEEYYRDRYLAAAILMFNP